MNKRRFWGNFVMVMGSLISLLSGGCAVSFAFSRVVSHLTGRDVGSSYRISFQDLIATTAFVGGIPFFMGIGLIIWGWKIRRRTEADKTSGLEAGEPK
jgi:hypothetical protein